MIKNIAVFGGAEVKADSQLYKDVIEFSKLLAKAGHTIVNGGGPGVMLASTEGAELGGGKTLSVTFDPTDAPGFEGRYVKNQTDQEIKTENYIARMFTLMENADCYVITNGGTGTLSELGTAWCLARLYFGNHKPFILYGTFWPEIISAFDRNLMLRPHDHDVFKYAFSPSEVLDAVNSFNMEQSEARKSTVDVIQNKEPELTDIPQRPIL